MYQKLCIASFASILPTLVMADIANCLTDAYPEIALVENNTITFRNSSMLSVGTISNLPFSQKINQASVADQLSQTYPLEFKIPKQYEDAGRIRNDEFFKQMYGKNQQEVKNNLVSINWKPSNTKILFSKINGASEQLEKVGNKIANRPDLKPYVIKSLGTFNWRKIAGTNRLSTHSFGIAIDFELPKPLHKYWRWDGCTTEDKICPYPKQLINDPKMNEVVKIFEEHGFIWGGKWASYDSIHFEYRPELVIHSCRG